MRRAAGSILIAAACAVPALAALSQRAAAPPQISLNTASPAFSVVGLLPGDSMTRCLRARNEGEEAIAMVDALAVTGPLAPYLRVSAERGGGLGELGPSCTGFAPAGGYAYGTQAGGVAPAALTPEADAAWPAHAAKSLRITVAMAPDAPLAASAKQATVAIAFAGTALEAPAGTEPPVLPGGIAPGTSGGFDKDGNFLSNAQIKKKLRIGRARLLANGDVVVRMFLPAGGAIRAKVILPNGVYYAHTLLPEEWGPTVRVLLKRRDVGRAATVRARRRGRSLVTRVTTRYRWAHGPKAFVEPAQRLTIVRRPKR
jgi:hypothetical protein